jgi:antirestriction protein ArdC
MRAEELGLTKAIPWCELLSSLDDGLSLTKLDDVSPGTRAGGTRSQGEHSEPIVYWNFVERTEKETGDVKSVPFLKYFSVFNAEQVEGIDAQIPTAGTERETTANQEAELIVADMPNRPRIENGAFPIACYCPSSDTVQMTEQKKLCVSDGRYYEVLFHELIHSTGNKSRVNREKDMGGWQQFGSREYSKEELIADVSGHSNPATKGRN